MPIGVIANAFLAIPPSPALPILPANPFAPLSKPLPALNAIPIGVKPNNLDAIDLVFLTGSIALPEPSPIPIPSAVPVYGARLPNVGSPDALGNKFCCGADGSCG